MLPEGGYFLLIQLAGADRDALADRAAEAGVPVVKGSSCFADPGGADELRLAYSACLSEDMDEGVSRLAALV